jgi:hypothetical protein
MKLLTKFKAFLDAQTAGTFFHAINPMRDWSIILGLSVLIFLASVVFNVYYFYVSTQASSFEVVSQSATASTSPVIDVKADIVQREIIRERLREGTVFVDPSNK